MNKQVGRKPGSVGRPILTIRRKMKINEFKRNDNEMYGIRGSQAWKRELLQYMSDPQLDIDDITRWVQTHRWITADDQLERETTPARLTSRRSRSSSSLRHQGDQVTWSNRNLRRSKPLTRETTPARLTSRRSRSSSSLRHQRDQVTKRQTRPMAPPVPQNRSRSHCGSTPASSEDTGMLNHSEVTDQNPGYLRQCQHRTPRMPILQPMITVSPQRIDFGNVVNADNYHNPSSTPSPVSSISQPCYLADQMEDTQVMSGIQVEENDNGNPLEPPQDTHPQQWPHIYEGRSPALHVPVQQQYVYIPANQVQMQSGNLHGNGIGSGASSPFILSDGTGSNWSQSQSSQAYGAPEFIQPPMNIPAPQPMTKAKQGEGSASMASDLVRGMDHLRGLTRIYGRHAAFSNCFTSVKQLYTVMQRAQKKDILAALKDANRKAVVKTETPDEAGAGQSENPAETGNDDDINCDYAFPVIVDLSNE